MNDGKPAMASKTMWVGFLLAVLGVVSEQIQELQLKQEWAGWVLAAIGIVMMALRAVTNQPIAKTKDGGK